jgi:hypothetical protein
MPTGIFSRREFRVGKPAAAEVADAVRRTVPRSSSR